MRDRAPAKIILFGEHAVVYGQPAIAVPFRALGVTVDTLVGEPGSGLLIRAHDTGVELRIIADTETFGDALSYAADLVITALGVPVPDVILDVNSTIPIASGLGSGAAVTTAIMRALSSAVRKPLADEPLNELVYEVEKMYHGTPSGIDNTVIVYERPIYFVRDKPPQSFHVGAPLTLIVADSGVSGSTREAVGDVRTLVETASTATMPTIERIGALVGEARKAIEAGDLTAIGSLMTENHKLLCELTVSLPILDTLVAAAAANGALGAKLSGGGRGGNVIALVASRQAERLAAALQAAGATRTWQTTVS